MIKKQIKYAFMDIRGNKRFFAGQFLLVLATFLLLGFCIWKYFSINEMRSVISVLINTKSTYVVFEDSDVDAYGLAVDNDDYQDAFYRLYQTMCQQEHYCIADDGMFYDEMYGDIDTARADINALKMFGLEREAKCLLDYDSASYTPVMLGHDLIKYHRVGDVLAEEYIIAGFLPKGAFYIAPRFSSTKINMDRIMLSLYSITPDTPSYIISGAINDMHVIIDDESVLKKIYDAANEIPTYSIKLIPVSDQTSRLYKSEMETVYYSLIFIAIASVLAVSCMITAMLTFIERHAKEFAIHLMCGATRNALRLRLIIQSGLQYILSYIITAAVCRNRYVTVFLLLICVFFFAIVTIVPSIKLRRDGLNNLLKRSE